MSETELNRSAVSPWVVMLLIAVIVGTGLVALQPSTEELYLKNTPVELKVAHVAMAKELQTLTPGDFFFMTEEILPEAGEKIFVVERDIGRSEFQYSLPIRNGWRTETPEVIGRVVKRIVRKTDPNWPEVAKQFFAQ